MKIFGYLCFVSMEGKLLFCLYLKYVCSDILSNVFFKQYLLGYLIFLIIGGIVVQGIVGKDSIIIDVQIDVFDLFDVKIEY